MKKKILIGVFVCVFILGGIFTIVSKSTVATNSKVSPTNQQYAIDPPNN